MKSTVQIRAQMDAMATLASSMGFQVKYHTRTETEGSAAGKTLVEITISTLTES